MKRLLARLLPAMLLAIGLAGFGAFYFLETRSGRPPVQPIAYSHALHAGGMQLACSRCHVHAEKSARATWPALALCQDCHRLTAADRPQIIKLRDYERQGREVPWQRVYRLPEHVYFTHRPHIRAGVDCTVCHGPVRQMQVQRQYTSLQMGWCLSCHRARRAGDDCLVCHK